MANGPEGSFWGAEQVPQAEIAPQASEAKQRFAALRDRAIEGAKEGFVGSVESGKAEKVADRAIDVAARTAEASLNGLPPGTRLLVAHLDLSTKNFQLSSAGAYRPIRMIPESSHYLYYPSQLEAECRPSQKPQALEYNFLQIQVRPEVVLPIRAIRLDY